MKYAQSSKDSITPQGNKSKILSHCTRVAPKTSWSQGTHRCVHTKIDERAHQQ